MRSRTVGRNISRTEVTNISGHGVWVMVAEKEYFLPYAEYPWFRDATVAAILDVELHHGNHLRWPQLDVDLGVESLECPEKYPLVYR